MDGRLRQIHPIQMKGKQGRHKAPIALPNCRQQQGIDGKVKGKYWFGIGKGERRGGWFYIQATERAIGPERIA